MFPVSIFLLLKPLSYCAHISFSQMLTIIKLSRIGHKRSMYMFTVAPFLQTLNTKKKVGEIQTNHLQLVLALEIETLSAIDSCSWIIHYSFLSTEKSLILFHWRDSYHSKSCQESDFPLKTCDWWYTNERKMENRALLEKTATMQKATGIMRAGSPFLSGLE